MSKKRKQEFEVIEEVTQESKPKKEDKKEHKVIFSEKVLTGISRLMVYKPMGGASKVKITNLTGGDLYIGETVLLGSKIGRGESKTFDGTVYVKSYSRFEILVEYLA